MKNLIYILVGCLFLGSCGDYLKEYSKDLAYASSCEDLDEILIGNGYMASGNNTSAFSGSSVQNGTYYYPWLHVMDDDITEFATGNYSTTSIGIPSTYLRSFYAWQQDPFQDLKGILYNDPNWIKLYEHIGYLNVIISQVKEFENDKVEVRNRVTGEAEFLRGAYYFLLVNMYGKPYVKATASTDLGVPLNLTEQIEDKYFSRASVKEVYEQIVKDLKNAAEHLNGIVQPTFYRVNEVAVRIFLSRVYLYMGEWKLALEEANKAIALGCPLKDLNEMDMGELSSSTTKEKNEYFYGLSCPEVMFTQGTNSMHLLMYDNARIGRYRASDELMELYSKYAGDGVTDLRLKGFFLTSLKDGNYYFVRKNSALLANIKVFDGFVIRTAEAYLNKAEAEFMLEDGDPISTLHVLLKNRFEGGNIPTSIAGLTGQQLINFIREERRRELCFECQRWFDLRRYAVCEKYAEKKEIKHAVMEPASASNVNGVHNGDYILKSYGDDPAWVLPIPAYEISYNKGNMVDNEAREERTLQ